MSNDSPRPSLTMYRAALGFKALIPASVSAILPFPYVSGTILETYTRLETYWRHIIYGCLCLPLDIIGH